MAGGCPTDASCVNAGVKVEACRRVARDLASREVFEVDGAGMSGGCESGFVAGDEESVSGESTIAEELKLVIEFEADSGGVPRAGVTAEGWTTAAKAVNLAMHCSRRAGTLATSEMRRIRLAAAVHMSLC